MKPTIVARKKALFAVLLAWAVAPHGFSGQPLAWEKVPAPVRETILANGGGIGEVDKENFKNEGKPVYEAPGRDGNGREVDLVVREDGKLMATKNDDAADRPKEEAERFQKTLAKTKFSHPREITNPYLPLASVKQDILEGTEDGKPVRIERTAKPEVRETFQVGGSTIKALAFEDREFEAGKLAEVAMDYFAQSDDGTVYYLGEDVDEYRDGKVVGHAGAWRLGKATEIPGVLLPAQPKIGETFLSENVPGITTERDEIISVSEVVTVPAGTFRNCLKVKETLSDGKIEFKYYAPGVGVVKEVPTEGKVLLKAHTVNPAPGSLPPGG